MPSEGVRRFIGFSQWWDPSDVDCGGDVPSSAIQIPINIEPALALCDSSFVNYSSGLQGQQPLI